MEQKDSRFAVLIDADNVSPKYIKYILDEVSDQGVATYKTDLRGLDRYLEEEAGRSSSCATRSTRSSSTAIRTEKIQLTPR